MVDTSHPYFLAFAGGLIIGLACTIHLLLKGRITGMSGIFNGLISPDDNFFWKSSLVSGLVFTSCIAYRLYGFDEVKGTYLFDSPQTFAAGASTFSIILAGLFVGLGTRLGNGCTSGHGVCGLPRFSIRSFAAVMTFMATGILTASFKPYLIPNSHQTTLDTLDNTDLTVNAALAISVVRLAVNFAKNPAGKRGVTDILVSFVVGSIFAVGLMISGMSRKSKVLGFLTFNKDWDMSLMFVMGGAVLLNVITFNYIYRIRKSSILSGSLSLPSQGKVDMRLLTGAALFGIGWGLAGICPGPAMLVTPIYFSTMVKFIVSMGIGQSIERVIDKIGTKQKLKVM